MADGPDSAGLRRVRGEQARRELYRYAYLLAGDRGLADDLVQEALVKTYVAWRRLRDPSNAEAYTRRVITRLRSAGGDVSPGTPNDPTATSRIARRTPTTRPRGSGCGTSSRSCHRGSGPRWFCGTTRI